MKIQAIRTPFPFRSSHELRSRPPVLGWALLGLLLAGAALTSLRAASLDDGFGPLSLVQGGVPVRGGCGRPVAVCSCGHKMGMDMDMDMGSTVFPSNLRLGGGDLDASPTTLTVTNVGASAYSINSVNNPILTFVRGETYTFNINANGHPFYIKTVQGNGTGNAYTNGVTGSGTQTGTVTFTVPLDAPSILFYDCSIHNAMTNRIDVVPEPSILAAVTALGFLAVVVTRRRAGRNAA